MEYYRIAPGKIVRADTSELTYHYKGDLPVGTVVNISHGRSQSSGIILGKTDKPAKFKTKPINKVHDYRLPEQLVETLVWMSQFYAVPLPLVVSGALPVGINKTRRARVEPPDVISRPMANFKLTPAQRQAASQVSRASSTVLLHGDTGSGKTLVYREAAKTTLKAGRSVLILVPEIGLTPQAASDYQDLADKVIVTHSDLSQSKRHQLWQAIASTELPMIVIGPRSALFMPIANLGLIVIDESHENSYKQDVSPRYQAQAVAAYLSSRHKAKLVLGSATPRITDYHLALTRKNRIITLPKYSQHGPRVTVVDKSQKDNFQRSRYLSQALIEGVDAALNKHQQALLYLNRRGTATVGLCVNCGWTANCRRCGSQLTLHKDLNQLRCHLCGFNAPIPSSCPDCGRPDIAYRGVGTKRIEEEATKLWPSAKIARFDTDNLKGKKLADLFADLHSGKINIAIGTQMIARGLDLPNLQFVGIVSADSELYLPDYSASERTFQLLYQAIGRAGRTGEGAVAVQAWQPEHPAIKLALKGDYGRFLKQELAARKAHNYPPFVHMMALIRAYSSQERAKQSAEDAKQVLASRFGLNTIGPSPAFYEQRNGKYRWQVVARTKQRSKLLPAAEHFRQAGWQVDLDPINLLY